MLFVNMFRIQIKMVLADENMAHVLVKPQWEFVKAINLSEVPTLPVILDYLDKQSSVPRMPYR